MGQHSSVRTNMLGHDGSRILREVKCAGNPRAAQTDPIGVVLLAESLSVSA